MSRYLLGRVSKNLTSAHGSCTAASSTKMANTTCGMFLRLPGNRPGADVSTAYGHMCAAQTWRRCSRRRCSPRGCLTENDSACLLADVSFHDTLPGAVDEGREESNLRAGQALRRRQQENSVRAPLLPLPPPKPLCDSQASGVCNKCGLDRSELQWALQRIQEYDRFLIHMRNFENDISRRVQAAEVFANVLG